MYWDLPQALEDEYGGFLNHKIIGDFQDYADFCFKTFGDQVAHWITLNEPVTFCPVTLPQSLTLQASICFLLTHTVNLYKKYQTYQKGQIGISVVTYWYLAKSETAASKKAASRSLDFVYGWFAHPVTFGDYPQTRRPSVADRLPEFSKEETKLLKGDFLVSLETFILDSLTSLSWLYIYPKGIQELMLYLKEKYNDPEIYMFWPTSSASSDEAMCFQKRKRAPVSPRGRGNIYELSLLGHLSRVGVSRATIGKSGASSGELWNVLGGEALRNGSSKRLRREIGFGER
ncbi:hypothetical protein ACLB2K_068253 [Fragaria x ananassa]